MFLSLRTHDRRGLFTGAHGLQWATWASVDAAAGRRLAIGDLVSDQEATTAIAERAFRVPKMSDSAGWVACRP